MANSIFNVGDVEGQIDALSDQIGAIEVVTGTMGDTVNTQYTTTFPSGFDAQNCCIIGYANLNSGNNKWYGNNPDVTVETYSNEAIRLKTVSTAFTSTSYKIWLMKYPK